MSEDLPGLQGPAGSWEGGILLLLDTGIELAYLSGPGPRFLGWKLRSREVESCGYGCSAKPSRVRCTHSPVAMFLFRQNLVFPAWGWWLGDGVVCSELVSQKGRRQYLSSTGASTDP